MSTAYENFNESLELVLALKKIERKKYSNSPKNNELPFVRGLRGGVAVLLVASFEFFLTKLFENNISRLNDELTKTPPKIDFNKLPEKLKIKTIYHSLYRAMNGPLFQERKKKIDRIPDILSACKTIISDNLNSAAFSETGSNPNGEVVINKFKEVGINDIFGKIKIEFERKWGKPEAVTFIKDTLDAIVNSRHIVAHTADTLHITRKSENESIKFIKILAEILEKELDSHVKELIKNAK